MLVKSSILGGDERLLDEQRHLAERDVGAPHQLQSALTRLARSVFARPGGHNVGSRVRGAAVEAARRQPHIGEVDR
jgi:hypothetical protein